MPYYFYPETLTLEDYKAWACMGFWSGPEGIMLSMGYNPRRDSDNLNKSEAENIAIEYFLRKEIVDRSGYTVGQEQAPTRSIPSRNESEDENETVFSPGPFTKWAMACFPSFPPELYKAVKALYPDDFVGSKAPGKTEANDKRLENPEFSLAKDLADKRWKANREMTAQAESYVREQFQKGCTCNHASLADFMTHDACDEGGNLIFNDRDIEEKTMNNILRKAAKNVLTEKAPSRIVGTKLYAMHDEPCPIHPR